MSLESNNSSRAPIIEQSVIDKLVSGAPDDLDLGPDNPPEEEVPTGKQWDADEDEAEERAAKKKPAAAAKPKEEPADDDEPEEKPVKRAAAPKDEPEPERAVLPKDKGTQDKPWTVKDLPEDGYVQVKVDGKTQVVSLKEAVTGIYIRTETFQSALSRANASHEEALQIAHDHLQERESIRNYFREAFTPPRNPNDRWPLYERLMQDPESAIELGRRIALQYNQWEANPGSLQEHKLRLKEQALDARDRRAQEEREQAEAKQKTTAAERAAIERLRPAHQECLKEAGFPKLTPQFQKKFAALFRAEQEESGQVTPDAYKALFRETMLLVKPESTVRDRAPAPQADPPRAAREPGRNGKKDWSSMPLNARLRDPDYML